MTASHRRIAVTGGIGSGKSVVCRIAGLMGIPVYDCDSRAAAIMASSAAIRSAISREIGAECIATDGSIDRQMLGRIVFNDPDALDTLNRIVHSAVRDDLAGWFESLAASPSFQDGTPMIVETAILYQSGLDLMVDEVWEVTAPDDVRIERVMQRNALSRSEVLARIKSQDSYVPDRVHPCVRTVVNDGTHALLPQTERLCQAAFEALR